MPGDAGATGDGARTGEEADPVGAAGPGKCGAAVRGTESYGAEACGTDGTEAMDGACGASAAGGAVSSPVMDRTAPRNWSSETGTTWEGTQVACAKASTAVSCPTKSTVLVRSCSVLPGVRQDVQS